MFFLCGFYAIVGVISGKCSLMELISDFFTCLGFCYTADFPEQELQVHESTDGGENAEA